MSTNFEIFWTFCFSLIVGISLLGNSIVIWIVCGKIFLDNGSQCNAIKLTTNYLLMNLMDKKYI